MIACPEAVSELSYIVVTRSFFSLSLFVLLTHIALRQAMVYLLAENHASLAVIEQDESFSKGVVARVPDYSGE